MRMKNILIIYGTRPEAIKLAPLVRAIDQSERLQPIVVSTGQHQHMLDQVNQWFAISPDFDLSVFSAGQSLSELSSRIYNRLPKVLDESNPDVVVVQGDTTTVAMAAISSFYAQIPVVHLEAGLRSHDILSPFPEEANRKLTTQVSALHLAPTSMARDNLEAEGVHPETICVTGNTVIDALNWTANQPVEFSNARLRLESSSDRPIVLLTTHRRENWGQPMTMVGNAIGELARRYQSHLFVFPAHSNPQVIESIGPAIHGLDNVLITAPLSYPEFVHIQRRSDFILTDSGGVQEEAPSLGKPVLVLRDNTERPEAVIAGAVKLIGTKASRIVEEATRLIENRTAYREMSQSINPYGDGHAAPRAVAAIEALLGIGVRLPDFSPDSDKIAY